MLTPPPAAAAAITVVLTDGKYHLLVIVVLATSWTFLQFICKSVLVDPATSSAGVSTIDS